MKDKLIEILRGARKRCPASGGGFCTPEIRVEGCAYAQYGEDCALHVMADELVAQGATVQKKGEWVQCFEDWRRQIEGDKCSACGFEHYGCSISHFHFCPNCGAKMDGDSDV